MPQGASSHRPGEPLAEALRKRGVDITREESARLASFLLSIASSGVLVPGSAAVHQDARLSPKRSSGGRTVGRGAAERVGPIVYNMGPSIHGNPGDAA